MDEFLISNVRRDDDVNQRELLAYLMANPRKGIRLRPEEQLALAFESGLVIELRKNAEICGCSFVYDFLATNSSTLFSEVGTMLVTENGYGLQWFISCLHLLQLRLENPESKNHIIFAVVGEGTDSEHILRDRAGFTKWDPPVSLASLRATAGTPFTEGKPVLIASDATVSDAISSLRVWHSTGNVFNTPKKDGKIRVKMGWFYPKLLELVNT